MLGIVTERRGNKKERTKTRFVSNQGYLPHNRDARRWPCAAVSIQSDASWEMATKIGLNLRRKIPWCASSIAQLLETQWSKRFSILLRVINQQNEHRLTNLGLRSGHLTARLYTVSERVSTSFGSNARLVDTCTIRRKTCSPTSFAQHRYGYVATQVFRVFSPEIS